MGGAIGVQGPVQGTVAPGFESVKRLYERETEAMAEQNTQLCVYHQGERVVDLWRSTTDDPEFSADSLVNVFSSGKSLETIPIASLVGQGLLDYEAKIADYWPEFAENDKGDITVADLMRHEAGLAAFNLPIPAEDLLPENIKQNRVGKVVEGHPARWPKGNGNQREYHAVTRGWIINELHRRVDPAGRTIGEWLQEELSVPLDADAFIGVAERELPRISPVVPLGVGYQLRQSLKPRVLGRKTKIGFLQLIGRLLRVIVGMRNATTRGAPPIFEGMKSIGFFNESAVAMGETPSAAANCSARGLAKIAAMMAAGGTWDDREFLSSKAWEALHAHPVHAPMIGAPSNFTQGGVNQFDKVGPRSSGMERAFNEGREGYFGWMGLGGSIFQWHPENEVGFAFVPTCLHVIDMMNERGKVYQAEVLRCVENLKGEFPSSR
jgi:CubicO group peptidase (beta-lactamase class C family)